MDARLQRTLYRLVATLIILAVAVSIVMFVHDDALRVAGIGLAAAAVLSLEEWLKNSGDNAPPTVAAINTALYNNATSVPPPKVAIPEAELLQPAPKPFEPPKGTLDTLP